uniref:Uncharacterized protein n=1 Tax=Anopheles gambiae TaxID=7165 RepID=A0A903XY95_ANOGA
MATNREMETGALLNTRRRLIKRRMVEWQCEFANQRQLPAVGEPQRNGVTLAAQRDKMLSDLLGRRIFRRRLEGVELEPSAAAERALPQRNDAVLDPMNVADTLPPRSTGEEDPPVISIISRGPLQRLALRRTPSAVGDAKPMTLESVAKVQVVEQNRVSMIRSPSISAAKAIRKVAVVAPMGVCEGVRKNPNCLNLTNKIANQNINIHQKYARLQVRLPPLEPSCSNKPTAVVLRLDHSAGTATVEQLAIEAGHYRHTSLIHG